LIVAGSLALYLAYGRIDPNATFYLLPTRAWELGVGSLAVLTLEGSRAGDFLRKLFWPALLALLVVPFLSIGRSVYGLDALLICVATLIVILRRHPRLEESLPVKGLAWVGDMSYSLYLVHWPLFAFAASAWIAPVPLSWRLGLTAASLILGYALYSLVEKPIRQAAIPLTLKSAASFAALSAAVIAVGLFIDYRQRTGSINYAELQRANVGFSKSCDFNERFEPTSDCRNGERPELLVWGDSHAMHLVPGLAATTEREVMQATRSACGPFLGLSYMSNAGSHNRRWAESCIRFNDSVLDYLKSADSIQVVVLASVSDQYLAGNRVVERPTADDSASGTWSEQDGSDERAALALGRTVSAIRALGKRVVFVTSMPIGGFDIGRCLELKSSGKPRLGADTADCSIDQQRFQESRAGALRLWRNVASQAGMPLIRLDDAVCREGTCRTELDGVLLYVDKAHLTYAGSRKLAESVGLGERAWKEAS
jgi:hypothetical protein